MTDPTEAGERGEAQVEYLPPDHLRFNVGGPDSLLPLPGPEAWRDRERILEAVEGLNRRAEAAEERLRRVEEALQRVADFPVAKFDGYTIERIKDVARDALDPKTPDE